MSVVDRLRERRLGRLASFCGVGGVGMVVDLAITFALLGRLSPLAANAVGWSVAVTHNFAGNWWLTFGQPDGSLSRQYAAYVGVHALTFGVRAVVLSGVLAATALPATVATVTGVGAAALVNFLASERIFGSGLVDALNRVAHRVWQTRLRGVLVATGGYQPVFDAYARILTAATPPTRAVQGGPLAVELQTATPTETVSVLHTAENEAAVLDRFVADLRPGDRVVDVGANVGVYAALAAAAGCEVVAVEPHWSTADRLRGNVPAATVHECALGAGVGEVGLAVRNDRPGTQRAAVGGATRTVRQLPGDRLATPDVLKIDVEGAEPGVLDGFRRALSGGRVRVVYVEVHGVATESAVRGRLDSAGYAVTDAWTVGPDETMLRAEVRDE
jgi:FkbM family methyltransferase